MTSHTSIAGVLAFLFLTLASVAAPAQDTGTRPTDARAGRWEARIERISKRNPALAEKLRSFRNLTPEERKARIERLRAMSPEERRAHLEKQFEENPALKAEREAFFAAHPNVKDAIEAIRKLSPEERRALRGEWQRRHPRGAGLLERRMRKAWRSAGERNSGK